MRTLTPLLLAAALTAASAAAPAAAQDAPPPLPGCGGVGIPSDSDYGSLDRDTVAGTPARLAYSTPSATSTITVTRTSPDPVAVVRVQAAQDRRVEFAFQATVNTVLESRTSDDRPECTPLVRRISVAPKVSLAARRNAVRDYTFSGRVFPGRGQTVTLYRAEPNSGKAPVITAQTTVRPGGTYLIDRRFTGSGEFIMYVTVSAVPSNIRGGSLGRPTVIH